MGRYDFDLDLTTTNTMSVIEAWVTENTNVLELGSANGRLTKYLSSVKKCRVTIVEMEEIAGKEAAEYASKAYIGVDDGNILNFKWLQEDKKFDYIIIADVLEHLSEPQLVLEKCRNVLKEKGQILVSIPNIAHNSIIIDLYNDRFKYSETGLLDKTHIHFFSYYSFVEMAEHIGLHLIEQKAIYSRVGWNEIENNYNDVPHEMAQLLRYRNGGSVYQYVFNLSYDEQMEKFNLKAIDVLEREYGKEAELSCFVWGGDNEGEPDYRYGKSYYIKCCNKCYVSIGREAKRIRLDILEDSALIRINKICIDINGCLKKVEIKSTNAKYIMEDIYYFDNDDPWLELDISENGHAEISGVEIDFIIYECCLSDERKKIYDCIIESNNVIAPKYVMHLENDIQELKYALEREREEAQSYIMHLENDIQELKCTLEWEREEAQNYRVHLENKRNEAKDDVEKVR